MHPMSDEGRARPSRRLLTESWEDAKSQHSAVLRLILPDIDKEAHEKVLSMLEGAYFDGAHTVLFISARVDEALEKGTLSDEAAAYVMVGIFREMNEYTLASHAAFEAELTTLQAQKSAKETINGSQSNPNSPRS